ncbi:MAG: J domain-containing protein, partial [Acetobacteraceae bacterium]
MDRDPEGHYARLGLAPTASRAAITAAYRRQARRLHPDVPGTGNVGAFVALKAAYDVLHDPDRRRAYDGAAADLVRTGGPAAWPDPTRPMTQAASPLP